MSDPSGKELTSNNNRENHMDQNKTGKRTKTNGTGKIKRRREKGIKKTKSQILVR
jgi:hypothetical protein